MSANIPVSHVVAWLRSLNATVVVEFVDRDDEMFVKLAENKREDYADYTSQNFQSEIAKRFTIEGQDEPEGGGSARCCYWSRSNRSRLVRGLPARHRTALSDRIWSRPPSA